jgi:outer membrane protein assembly factor BamE (lipoprotein component of BamABCDE complex)
VTQEELEVAATRWRATRSPADLIQVAQMIPPGSERARVRELLGDPLVVSELADGGESWLYVRADPEAGQLESMSVGFDASGGFTRLDRKPLD